MNKKELIAQVAEKTEFSKKDAGEAVDAVLDTITEALTEKEKVQLIGFGTFETRERAAREGRNPSDGTPVDIPARTVAAFKPGKKLKEIVNQ